MKKNHKDIKFDKRASAYDAGIEGKASQRFYNLLLKQVELKPGATVLDVGCGTGTLLYRMSQKGEILGYGIDVEENMIAEAKKKCPGMTIQTSACEKIPFDDDTFDVLTACMAYHHFSDKAGFTKEAARILKAGGLLYIADPRFPFPLRKTINSIAKLFRFTGEFFSPQEIANDFRNVGFELVDVSCDGIAQVVTLRKC